MSETKIHALGPQSPAVHPCRELAHLRRQIDLKSHTARVGPENQPNEEGPRFSGAVRILQWCGMDPCWSLQVESHHELPQSRLAPGRPPSQRIVTISRDIHLHVVSMGLEEVGRSEKPTPGPLELLRRPRFRMREFLNSPRFAPSKRQLFFDGSQLRRADIVRRIHGRVRRRDDGREVGAVAGVEPAYRVSWLSLGAVAAMASRRFLS